MMPAVGSDGPIDRMEGCPVEMIIGLALIVISALLMVFIMRTVQANMPRG